MNNRSLLHGKVIHYNDIAKYLPKRANFLEKEIYNKVTKNIKKEKNLLFFPTSVWDDKPMQSFKYDKSKYKLVLFGILEDGRRVSVVINDILPYFEIKIPDDQMIRYNEFVEELLQELSMDSEDYENFINVTHGKFRNNKYWKIEPVDHKIIEGKPLKYYQEENSHYVQIYFNKLAHRKDAITYARAKGYETTHDDMSCYYRVACRDALLSFASWLNLGEFTSQSNGMNDYLKGDVIQVSVNNIEVLDTSSYSSSLSVDVSHLQKDKTMTMCWDIETFNSANDGEIPQPMIQEKNITLDDKGKSVSVVRDTKYPNWNHTIFMIGITFQWFHSNEQLLRICLVDVPSAPHPDFLTIICGDEQNLIKAFAKCYENMQPEIIMGFNDAGYDWPWVVKRARAYKGLLKYIGDKFDITKQENRTDSSTEYSFKSLTIKIEADVNANGDNLQLPGYIPVDVMIVFRQLYPTSEKWNLNFFLSKNKLGSKEDMPYYEMFEIYRQSKELLQNSAEAPIDQLEKMALVGKYCVIDAQRCHELMKIRSVMQDKREVSIGSYTSVFDAFYRANGMKVRNLVIARAQLRGLRVSNISNEEVEQGKYPGAWVFPPIKGLLVSKLSVAERIKKGQMGYEEYVDWTEKSEEEIKDGLEFIKQNGAFISSPDVQNNIGPSLRKMLEESTGRPITGLDFSSLYPSLMMAYNLSPEYIILDKKFAREINDMKNEDGTKKHTLHRIEFPFNGRTIKGWSIRHDNKLDPTQPDYKFGIFPAILKELFDTRTKLKKDARGLNYWEHRKESLLLLAKTDPDKWDSAEIQKEFEDVCFNYNALDSKQKALKVFMNTFYGEAGNKRSPLFLLQVAGGITTAGQKNIKKAYSFVQDKGCKVYYGDSVPADSPVLIRFPNGNVDIRTIDDIPTQNEWFGYPQFKPAETEPIRINKQQHLPLKGLEIWSSHGWVPIKRVIRHKTNKRMFRVNTHTGVVDVTEDHSLMNSVKEAIKPIDVEIGTELFHSFPTEFNNNINKEITEEEAYVWGFFHGNGSCGYYECPNGKKYSWVLSNQNMTYLNQLLEYLKTVEPGFDFKLLDTVESPNVYKLVAVGKVAPLVEKYRNMFYDQRKYKRIPISILNSLDTIRRAYWNGLYASDGHKAGEIKHDSISICQKGKINAQCVYYLLRSLGYNVEIHLSEIKPDIYWISSLKSNRVTPRAIKKIIELPPSTHDEFVYDIETEDGTFLTGVGNINCFQTDSLYISMPEQKFNSLDLEYYTEQITKLQYWEQMVQITFEVIQELNKEVNQMFINDNGTNFLKMAYEEVLFPVLFTAKKKYVGIPHISKPNFDSNVPLFIRGLELKKRGVSGILKNVCGDILVNATRVENVLTVIEIVQNKIREVYTTDWSDHFNDFIMTAVYKPNKQNVKVHTFRDRMMLERGIELKAGERIKYIIAKRFPYKYDMRGRKSPLKIGDKMELAELAKEEKIPIDLDYYMERGINGQLARFITYHPSFHVEPASYTDSDEVKKAEDSILRNARKFINMFCKEYYAKYEDVGKARKSTFRESAKIVSQAMLSKYDYDIVIKLLGFSVKVDDEIGNWLIKKVFSVVEKKKENKAYGSTYIDSQLKNLTRKERKIKILSLQNLYYSNKQYNLLKCCEKNFNERHTILEIRLRKSLYCVKDLFNTNNMIIQDVIKHGNHLEENMTLNEQEFESELKLLAKKRIEQHSEKLEKNIAELRYIYVNAIGNYEYIYRIRSIVEYLKQLRDTYIGNIKPPKNMDEIVSNMTKEATEEFIRQN
jgi:DNA polymerase elongation subunit (family B)